jgi:hypothetical protein
MDRGKSIEEVAGLTDRQIAELCFPPRDEQGRVIHAVELPGEDDPPMTKEQERAALFGMGRALGVPEAELQAAWRGKYGDT